MLSRVSCRFAGVVSFQQCDPDSRTYLAIGVLDAAGLAALDAAAQAITVTWRRGDRLQVASDTALGL